MLSRRSLLGSATLLTSGLLLGADRAVAAPPVQADTQAPGFYRYRVGDFQVTVVTDGINIFPVPDGFVVNASKGDVGAALAAAHLDPERLAIPYSPILVHTGRHLVLIDTGTGEANFAASKGRAGQFRRNLAAAGVSADAIDAVVISHFHGDHVNGLLDASGKPAFPRAEVFVPEAEWAYWMDDGQMSRAPTGRLEGLFKNSRRVFDALDRKVTRYAWDREVVPGIHATGTPGHTPGHTSYVVTSGDSRLFVQSDVTNLPALFVRNPGWHAGFDQDGPMAEETRRRVYDMLAAERMLVQGFHYPFPALARVEKAGSGYREIPQPWMPVL